MLVSGCDSNFIIARAQESRNCPKGQVPRSQCDGVSQYDRHRPGSGRPTTGSYDSLTTKRAQNSPRAINQSFTRAIVKWRTPRGPQLRYCAKIALAAVAAYALTLGGRNEYALYSVLGATLVMGTSVGDDLHSSLNRVRGTLAGAIVGAAVAYTLGKSIWSFGIAVAVLAWFSVGLGGGIAALRVGIAMALVTLFTHVDDAAHYGLWRIVNTLIGVSIGVAVSRLIWPIRGRDEIAGAIDQTRAATAGVLDAMGRDASSDLLQQQQVQVIDALAAIRTARTNARRGQPLDRQPDLLEEQTRLAAVTAITTLEASLRLDQLAQAGARAECLQAARSAIALLAAYANDEATFEQLERDFNTAHEAALRDAEHPSVDVALRTSLVGLFSQLEQIRTALRTLRDDDAQRSS